MRDDIVDELIKVEVKPDSFFVWDCLDVVVAGVGKLEESLDSLPGMFKEGNSVGGRFDKP